jgi:Alpha-1,3-glucanase catalytic domain D1/Alpha-1,3-glucanase catalytic domain D2
VAAHRLIWAAVAVGASVLVVNGRAAPAQRGAAVPFTEYQAETATTDGTVLGASRAFGTLAAEASRRRAVRLQPSQYVEFTLTAPANAVDVRYSISDSVDGTGTTAALGVVADGRLLASLSLTSAYSWFYGGYPFSNDPRAGGAHHFYDAARALLGTPVPAGAKVRLVAAATTVVDLADFELVAAPAAQPAGSLSVIDFGADPSGARDSTAAFRSALAAGNHVWIPPGTFTVTGHLLVDDVTLEGAGPWYSVLRGDGVGVYGYPAPHPSAHVRLAGFAIFGEVKDRDDAAQVNGIGGALSDSTISNLWIEHTKVGMWLDGPFDGLTIAGCRIQDTTADGINLHRAVTNTVVENTVVRNTGDDGLAIWSDASTGQRAARENVFRFDTVELPVLANGIAFYGGTDNAATDDIIRDTVTEGGGIHVGNRFSSTPLAGTTTIARDTIVRSGSMNPHTRTPIGALWLYALDAPLSSVVDVRDTIVDESTYAALHVYGSAVRNLRLRGVRIDRAGTFGLQVQANGRATLADVRATRLGAAGVYVCPSANTFRIVGRAPGLRSRYCGPFPAPRRR